MSFDMKQTDQQILALITTVSFIKHNADYNPLWPFLKLSSKKKKSFKKQIIRLFTQVHTYESEVKTIVIKN